MRLLLVSDVHSNYRALAAALDRFHDVDEVWCLGDVVEYGPCPAECIDLVRERCDRVIAGNHDASFVAGHKGWALYDRHTASDDGIAWLRDLPESATVELDGKSVLLVHGTPALPLDGKLYPTDGPDAFRSALGACQTDIVLCGHTHVAMVQPFDGKTIVNTGTIGQPRDGDYRAQCMIYEDGRFRFERVDYDLSALARDYDRSPLPRQVKTDWLHYTRQGIVDVHGLQLGPFSTPR